MAIGLSEACRLTGKPKSTIHRAMQAQRLPFTTGPGNTRLIEVDDLERLYPLLQPRNPAKEPSVAEPEETEPQKPVSGVSGAGRRALKTDDRAMIYRGCTVAQLSEIFGMRDVTVFKRIAGIEPSGIGHGGALIYRIIDVAPRLIQLRLSEDVIREHLATMRPQDLPQGLHKAYWDGAMARHRFAEKSGELWPTEDVLAGASLAFQTLRQGLLLLPDQLRSEADINETQHAATQRIVDELIEGLRERLITDFESGKHRRSSASNNSPIGSA